MCLLTTILNIGVSGINIAIPTIASEFHAYLPSMEWVINIYVLMSAALQILGGR
jgi:MFS family permease